MTQIVPVLTFESVSAELSIAYSKMCKEGTVDTKSNRYVIASTEVHRIVRLAKSHGYDIDALWANIGTRPEFNDVTMY